jgi:hypothetical protein
MIFARNLHDFPLDFHWNGRFSIIFPWTNHGFLMFPIGFPEKSWFLGDFPSMDRGLALQSAFQCHGGAGASCWDSWPKLILFIVIYSYYITNMKIIIHRCW